MEKRIFTKYKLQLVKESAGKYEVDKKITCPRDVKEVLINVVNLHLECEEVFILITLDTKNVVNGIFEVSRGVLNSALIHPREVFKRAILQNSNSIMVAHNHPSEDTTPSKEDINITQRLIESGKILGIEVLDHIIIGNELKYLSFKEKGLL